MPGIRLLPLMRAAINLFPAWCSQTAMQVTVRLSGDEVAFNPSSPAECPGDPGSPFDAVLQIVGMS